MMMMMMIMMMMTTTSRFNAVSQNSPESSKAQENLLRSHLKLYPDINLPLLHHLSF
jgi:hypothetical protein